MKIVMAFGTFDIFHPGHKNYLKQAGRLGEYLIVVVARDRTVSRIKKKEVRIKEQKRKVVLEKSGLADKIILGNLKDKYAVIGKYKPDVIALGYDQKVDLAKLKNKLKEFKIAAKVVRMKAYKPEIYKSSKLKHKAYKK